MEPLTPVNDKISIESYLTIVHNAMRTTIEI